MDAIKLFYLLSFRLLFFIFSFKLMLRFVKNFKTIIFSKANKHASLINNTVVTVVLMTGADLMQQNIEHSTSKNLNDQTFDHLRSRNLTIVGLATGSLMHGWYTILDRKYHSKALNVVVKKVALDQVIGSPLFLLVYFIGLSLLEGQTFKSSCIELKEKFPLAYLVSFFFFK